MGATIEEYIVHSCQ